MNKQSLSECLRQAAIWLEAGNDLNAPILCSLAEAAQRLEERVSRLEPPEDSAPPPVCDHLVVDQVWVGMDGLVYGICRRCCRNVYATGWALTKSSPTYGRSDLHSSPEALP